MVEHPDQHGQFATPRADSAARYTGPLCAGRPGALADVLTEGGFTDVRVREVQTPMQVQTFDEWWNVVPSLAGPIAPVLASLPTELTTAIRTEPRLRWRSFTPAAVTSCLD